MTASESTESVRAAKASQFEISHFHNQEGRLIRIKGARSSRFKEWTMHSVHSNPNHPHPHRLRALGQPRIERRQRVAAQRGDRQVERVATECDGALERRTPGVI